MAVRLRERAASSLGCVYTCGRLSLDTASHTVLAAGEPVSLTRTEYAILKLLLQNPGQVLAKSTLLDRISAGLHGALPQAAREQPPAQAGHEDRRGLHRSRLGHWLPAESLTKS